MSVNLSSSVRAQSASSAIPAPAQNTSAPATPGIALDSAQLSSKVVAAPPPAKASAGPLGWFRRLGADLRHVGSDVGSWILTPYLNEAAKIGVKQFVLPDNHTPDSTNPGKLGLAYQELSFKSGTDGTPLKGWYIPAASPSAKTVVLACGHGSQMGNEMSQYAPWLHKAGYNVVCFDFRDSGSSGGTQCTMGDKEQGDLKAAIDQAQAKGAKQIAVLGVSMGAATAIGEAGNDPRVTAVVADCPFDTLDNAVIPRVKTTRVSFGPFKNVLLPFPSLVGKAIIKASDKATGTQIEAAAPINTISKLGNRPLFLIHGGADDATPTQCSKTLNQMDPSSQLWVVPGAGHAASYKTAPQQYQAKVLSFLSQNLPSS